VLPSLTSVIERIAADAQSGELFINMGPHNLPGTGRLFHLHDRRKS